MPRNKMMRDRLCNILSEKGASTSDELCKYVKEYRGYEGKKSNYYYLNKRQIVSLCIADKRIGRTLNVDATKTIWFLKKVVD